MKLAWVVLVAALGCGGGGDGQRPDAGEPATDGGGERPDADEPATAGGGPGLDAGRTDDAGEPVADGGHRPDDAGPPLDGGSTHIAFSLPPPSVTYVSGMVTLQIVVTGVEPDRVELWRNGSILTVLALPYTYTWDTTLEADGPYEIEARAIRGGVTVASASRDFIIDRIAPSIVSREPSPGSDSVLLSRPIVIEFSEPMDPATIDDTTVLLTAAGSSIPHTRTLSADMSTVELTLADVPASLPAEATVEVLGTVADPAGNTLGAADSFSFTYPPWVRVHEDTSLPTPWTLHDAVIAPDGTAWIAYSAQTMSSPAAHTLYIARWDGSGWMTMGDTLAVDVSSVVHARLLFRSAMDLVVLGQYYTDALETSTWTWDGTTWSTGAAPPRSDEYASNFEPALYPSGDVLLARRLNEADEVVAHRLSGSGWTAVAPAIPITGAVRFLDAYAGGGTAVLSYYSGYSCSAVSDAGGTWTSLGYVHRGFSFYSECRAAWLVEHDGVLHAATSYRTQTGTYSSTPGGKIRERVSSGWADVGAFYSTDGYVGVAPTTTGFLAAFYDGGTSSDIGVMDETLSTLPGMLDILFFRLLVRSDRPVLVSRDAVFYERNGL